MVNQNRGKVPKKPAKLGPVGHKPANISELLTKRRLLGYINIKVNNAKPKNPYLCVMEKRFNVTGTCFPQQHYMADTSAKLARTLNMVELGEYFIINRPRQYGKTTMLVQLIEALRQQDGYLPFMISFEGVGDDVFEQESAFAPMFFRQLATSIKYIDRPLSEHILEVSATLKNLGALSEAISDLVDKSSKKIVLLIDEVDKSSNNQLFVSFLGVLRNKYLSRYSAPTFHAVVLAGVHDIKTLKLKIRPEAERKYNSPWNIAADFKVEMSLQKSEILPMLREYAQDRNISVDTQAVAERLLYYTAGHPFLVSKLCKIFDEELLPPKKERLWAPHDVDMAARQLMRESNANFDDLIKNIENNPELRALIQSVVLYERDIPFDLHEPLTNLGAVYGLFKEQNGRLAIFNRIYAEIIANYMTASILVREQAKLPVGEPPGPYLLPGNRFDVKQALRKFQAWMKTEGSKKDQAFLERQGRLVFLAFLKPILNGHGHALKEPQISDERRLDVLIAYHEYQYVIELKIWRGQEAHQKGLDQLTAYLNSLGLEEGALLIFDPGKGKHPPEIETIHNGKRIFVVWV